MPSGFVTPYDGSRGRTWKGMIRYLDLDGVEQRKKVTLGRAPAMTEREAERELGRRLDAIEKGANAASRETVAAFAIRFLDVYMPSRNLKRSTEIDYRNTLERHVIPHLGSVDMAVLAGRPELLDRYVLAKTRERLSPKTIGNHLSTVSKLFEVAIRWRLVSQNPVAMIDRPRVEQTDTPVLTETEIARLLTAYGELERDAEESERPWWSIARRLVVVALGTALRRGELLGLRWIDVELLEQRLHVRRSFVCGEMVTPKSRAGRRTVGFGPVTAEALNEQWTASRHRADTELVFGHPLLGTPLDPSKLSGYMRTALKRAAIEKGLRPWHDLRHTALTHDAAVGNPQAYIQARAGHSQGSITERYIHAAQVAFPGAAERAEDRLFSGVSVPSSVPNELPRLDSNQQPSG